MIEGTSGASSENYDKLVDNNSGTKWCVTNFSDAYIIFKVTEAVAVSGYSITTGGNTDKYPGKNPKNWKPYGSTATENLGETLESWELIHSVTNDTILQGESTETYDYAFDKTTKAYRFFKLEITATKGDNVMQMSEFTLTSCDHS